VSTIEKLALSALAATALALGGASPAAASESTALCSAKENPCAFKNLVESVHLVGEATLKTELGTISCLSSLVHSYTESPRLAIAPLPLGISVGEIHWSECGIGGSHENCDLETANQGLIDVLKTAPGLAEATWLNLVVLASCEYLFGFHCEFGGAEVGPMTFEGALHQEGTGNGSLSGTEMPVTVGHMLCPTKGQLTVDYEPLAHMYVAS
jgi:hypothetical protein